MSDIFNRSRLLRLAKAVERATFLPGIGSDPELYRAFIEVNAFLRVLCNLGGDRIVRHDHVRVDLTRPHIVHVGDREIKLQGVSYRMLCLFLANPGRVLSKEHIAKSIWGTVDVDPNLVVVAVNRLRRAIERYKDCPQLIRTVIGEGYALVTADDPVKEHEDRTAIIGAALHVAATAPVPVMPR